MKMTRIQKLVRGLLLGAAVAVASLSIAAAAPAAAVSVRAEQTITISGTIQGGTTDEIVKVKTSGGDMLIKIDSGTDFGTSKVLIAGIMGAKRTSELIPLCHILHLTGVEVWFEPEAEESRIRAFCRAKTTGKTGVEMEALTGVQIALLTIYDMCKAVDKRMVISDVHLLSKSGGKSGDFRY